MPAHKNTAATPLSRKHARFVAEFLVDLNAALAMQRIGHKNPKTANREGYRLLQKPHIAAAIAAAQAKRLQAADLTAARTLEEIRRLAFSNIKRLFDEHGNLKPIHELSDEDAACIAVVEVIIKNAAAGDNHTDTIHKIKLWPKDRALELLAKHYALLVEQVHLISDDELLAHLDQIKARNAQTKPKASK